MMRNRPLPLFGVLTLLLTLGCGPGRPAPSAPTPADRAGTAAPRARGYEIPVVESFARAVSRGTRTTTGEPGPGYWQQWADYRLEAELNPVSKRLTGRGTIAYHNRSPDTLATVYVHLLHNLFSPEARHNTDVPWAVEGIALSRVAAQGRELRPVEEGPGYRVNGTVMRVDLPQPLPPGGRAELEIAWRLRVPPDGAPRGGQDGEAWYISYWYPQMAVYDDVNGWQIDQYLGQAEFYLGYGNYDVAITVPAGWLVSATGTLQNPAEVLSAQTRARLDSAGRTPEVVRVVGDSDRVAGRSTAPGAEGKLTWRFRAEHVRDISWATSARYLWDATHAVVGDRNGDGRPDTTAIHALYRPEKRRSHWNQSARYARHSIEFFSRSLWPYPYPHMSAVDGPDSCGGMEFPMMTCIGGQWDTLGLYEVTTHEIGHMWFPMQVGSDEKRHAWMDEGFTQFYQSQAMADLFKGYDDETENRRAYLDFAETGGEVELMRHGDRYPNYWSYGVASYYKPVAVLMGLRGALGRERFRRAFAAYGERWQFKHPMPYDFFNTVEQVAGEDLDWFWRTWFYETWRLDQTIDTVLVTGDSVEVVVENRGRAPMPVHLTVTRSDGSTERVTAPADVWLSGERRVRLRVAGTPTPRRFELDAARDFPDLDRANQVWPR